MSEIIKPEDVPDEMVKHYLSTKLRVSWKHLIACDMNAAIEAGLVSPPCHVKRHLGDMQPPFEGPIESIEPILDPARVLATARWFLNNSDKDTHGIIAYLIAFHCGDSSNAKPYKLKGGEE